MTRRYTLADIIAESRTDKRGTCVKCERDEVPLGDNDICLPCAMKAIEKDPQLSRALDQAAERITNKIGKDTEPKD